MAYTWPTDPTVAFGTSFQGPPDVKQVILNAQDMESRLNALEHLATRAVTAGTTLVLADDGKAVEVTSASAAAVTVPPASSVAYVAGAVILVATLGAGVTSITAGTGVTIIARTSAGAVTLTSGQSAALSGQNAGVALRYRGSDSWHLTGDLA